MGAALVKHCFSGCSDASDNAHNERRPLAKATSRGSYRHSNSYSYGVGSTLNTNNDEDTTAAALLAKRTRQLRQLERQMQQLTKQHSKSSNGSSSSSRHSSAARATMIAPATRALSSASTPSSSSSGARVLLQSQSLASSSSYSTTMSESSFTNAILSCSNDAVTSHEPQDDEILDMVMASAGLAFHPTQQWSHSHSHSRQATTTTQSPLLPLPVASLPTTRPAAAAPLPLPLPRRLSTSQSQSFRSLLPASYTLQEVLGTGTTSTCYRCVRTTDERAFACKVIDKRRLAVTTRQRHDIAFQLRREVDVLQRVDHPNIAKLEAAFENDAFLVLVMELLDGGELFDAIVERGRFAEADAQRVAADVLSAMTYMHALGVVHRDLKPENMLLAVTTATANNSRRCNSRDSLDLNGQDELSVATGELVVKIIDFGFAKFLAGEFATTTSFLGTGGYLAPEILLHQPYTAAVDMWAFGVLLYLLLCGRLPFAASTHLRPNQKITSLYRLTFPAKYWSHVSADARDLVERILVLNPRKRLTAKEASEHKWLKNAA